MNDPECSIRGGVELCACVCVCVCGGGGGGVEAYLRAFVYMYVFHCVFFALFSVKKDKLNRIYESVFPPAFMLPLVPLCFKIHSLSLSLSLSHSHARTHTSTHTHRHTHTHTYLN